MRSRLVARCACLIAGVLLGVAGDTRAAPLGDNMVKLQPSRLKLAQNIGPLRYTGSNRYSDRRLGRSFGYGASGISLTIYVYDYGLRELPDGPDSVPVCEQFERARREIESGGNYQNVRLRGQVKRRMLDRADAPEVREALYELERNGIHALSALWVTAVDGHFVKLRLSLRREVADELDQARARVLAAMAESFAARPSRAPPAPANSPAVAIELNATNDPDDSPLWLAYGMEVARVSRELPDGWPPCGGTLVPPYTAELAGRQVALREYRAREAGARGSKYFDALARIDAAGFLDEYVWHFLRRPADTTPPTELRLGDFEEFRARELGTHVVETGAHVKVNGVRALPTE